MSEQERNWEEEATKQGWRPQDDWDGPEDKWKDAKTFVKDGEQILGYLKPQLSKLEQKLKHQEQLNKDFAAQIERERKSKQKEIEQLEAKVKAARTQAINDGNGAAFNKAEEQLEEIRQAKEEIQPPKQDNAPPEWAVDWMTDNEWYGKDTALTGIAEAYSQQLRTLNPTLQGREFLEKVAEYVKSEMPHKFNLQKVDKDKDPEVEGVTNKKSKSDSDDDTPPKGKSYRSLPKEAKAECDRLIKAGMVKDREQYAMYYFEDE